MSSGYIDLPVEGGGGAGGINSINGNMNSAQLIVAGSGISVSSSGGTTTITNTGAIVTGNLTDTGIDGIVIGNGTGAVNGTGTTIAQHVADASHNGYLSSTDWSTFNGKQAALTIGNLTDVGTDGITVSGGTGAIIGSGTSLSQHVADTSHNGYLSSTDWNTFNSKQAAGSYITSLTSDVTASGPGAAAATIASHAVTNAKLAQMAANTIKGNNTGSISNAADLTVSQGRTLLQVFTTFFVYKPQTLVPAQNVYNDWGSLYTELSRTKGFRQILFDSTDDSGGNFTPISIPAGSYDMTNVQWTGQYGADGNPSTIAQNTGTTFINLINFGDNLLFLSLSSSSLVTLTGLVETFITIGTAVNISNQGSAALFTFDGTNAVIILGSGSNINNGSYESFNLINDSALIIFGDALTGLGTNTVRDDGTGTLELFVGVGSSTQSPIQSNFTGTIFTSLSDVAINHFYDDSLHPSINLSVSTVQDAIDQIASGVDPAYELVTATSAGSHTIGAYIDACFLNASGTLTSYTVTMPASPFDGQRITITTNHIISTFTLAANSGHTFVGTPPTTLTLGQTIQYRYISSLTQWWPA